MKKAGDPRELRSVLFLPFFLLLPPFAPLSSCYSFPLPLYRLNLHYLLFFIISFDFLLFAKFPLSLSLSMRGHGVQLQLVAVNGGREFLHSRPRITDGRA